MMDTAQAALNTDRELWREPTNRIGHEFYMPSIHVTDSGAIGINVDGRVFVMPLREWHALALEKHGWPTLAEQGDCTDNPVAEGGNE